MLRIQSFLLIFFCAFQYGSGQDLLNDSKGEISRVYISMAKTGDQSTLPKEELLKGSAAAKYFYDKIGCDACLIWFYMVDGSIVNWKIDVENSLSEPNNELIALKKKFDESLKVYYSANINAESIKFPPNLDLQKELDQAWGNLLFNPQHFGIDKLSATKDTMLILRSERFENETNSILIPDLAKLVQTKLDKPYLLDDWNWRIAFYKSQVEKVNEAKNACVGTGTLADCYKVVRVVDYSLFTSCTGLNDYDCEQRLSNSMQEWIQDRFNTVLINDKEEPIIYSTNTDSTGNAIEMPIVDYLKSYCGDNLVTGNTVVQGGNVWYTDSLTFIGKDVLEYYRDDKNRWAYEKLGLTSATNNKKNIESKIIEELHLKNVKIVWVGIPKGKFNYAPTHLKYHVNGKRGFSSMPAYHLDIFFNPGPILAGKQIYLMGVVEPANKPAATKEELRICKKLNCRIMKCMTTVDDAILQKRLTPIRIEIPLRANFHENAGTTEIKEYISYPNGLFETTDSECRYLIPSEPENYSGNEERMADIIGNLKTYGITAIPIWETVVRNSGIHCQVKVIKRK